MTTEAKIHADIDAIRQQALGTQDLYREVCAILFFRYGVTPTANKLYQYVRKGSMSAPAEALAKFWEDLREKSRVRIEHPDLPEALKSAAGEMVANLWSHAQKAAQESLATLRSDIQAGIQEAQQALSLAENELESALRERDEARDTAQAAMDRTLQLERDLAAERAGNAALLHQLEAAARQQETLDAALTEARHDFAAELEKLRQAQVGSDIRSEAAEKRALLEIDRERTAAAKLQKELAQVRQYQQETEERNRAEVRRLQSELGDARQQLGVAEGMLTEAQRTVQQQSLELQALRNAVTESETRSTLLERKLEVCRKTNATMAQALAQRESGLTAESEPAKPKRRSRKTVVLG